MSTRDWGNDVLHAPKHRRRILGQNAQLLPEHDRLRLRIRVVSRIDLLLNDGYRGDGEQRRALGRVGVMHRHLRLARGLGFVGRKVSREEGFPSGVSAGAAATAAYRGGVPRIELVPFIGLFVMGERRRGLKVSVPEGAGEDAVVLGEGARSPLVVRICRGHDGGGETGAIAAVGPFNFVRLLSFVSVVCK